MKERGFVEAVDAFMSYWRVPIGHRPGFVKQRVKRWAGSCSPPLGLGQLEHLSDEPTQGARP
jgi:hypothetical protein